jgi:hypothetical protein
MEDSQKTDCAWRRTLAEISAFYINNMHVLCMTNRHAISKLWVANIEISNHVSQPPCMCNQTCELCVQLLSLVQITWAPVLVMQQKWYSLITRASYLCFAVVFPYFYFLGPHHMLLTQTWSLLFSKPSSYVIPFRAKLWGHLSSCNSLDKNPPPTASHDANKKDPYLQDLCYNLCKKESRVLLSPIAQIRNKQVVQIPGLSVGVRHWCSYFWAGRALTRHGRVGTHIPSGCQARHHPENESEIRGWMDLQMAWEIRYACTTPVC